MMPGGVQRNSSMDNREGSCLDSFEDLSFVRRLTI